MTAKGSGPYVVRDARPEELDAVGALTAEAYAVDGHLDAEPEYTDVLRDARDRAGHAALLVVVDAEEALLGTVTYCRPGTPYAEVARPDEAEFRMLAVGPEARGRGVAEALVRACLVRARDEGYHGLALTTLEGMAQARRLYERLRFVRDPSRDWSVPGVSLIVYAVRFRETWSA